MHATRQHEGQEPYANTAPIVEPPMVDGGESPTTAHGSGSNEWITVEASGTHAETEGLRTPDGPPAELVPAAATDEQA